MIDEDWSAHDNCDHSFENLKPEVQEAVMDVRLGRNLIGPFATAEEAFAKWLNDDPE